MPVHYRRLQPDEEATAIDLWVEVFPGTDRAQWAKEFGWDPQRFARTYVAVAEDGTLLATARYFMRDIRGAAGEQHRAGWLCNVATRPGAQRQGHGSRLLARVEDVMQQEGCAWSLLTADSTAQGFYARRGWKGFPLPYQQGAFVTQDLDRTDQYPVRPYDPATEVRGWELLAAIYDEYNATRPLTVVRDQNYWQYARPRMRAWLAYADATCLAAESASQPGAPVAYVLAHFGEMGLLITEVGAQGQHNAALSALVQATVDQLAARGFPAQGRVYLPHDTPIDQLVQRLFGHTLHTGADAAIMARGIGGGLSDQAIEAIIAAPGAMCWPLDDY